MEGIKISDLHFVGENDRGATYEFDNLRTGTQTLGMRNAGSINGRHYHAGNSASKAPEIFILMKGSLELYARNLQTGEELTAIMNGPARLEIAPYVWHVITAITDIVFIELNSIAEHAADTYYDQEGKAGS